MAPSKAGKLKVKSAKAKLRPQKVRPQVEEEDGQPAHAPAVQHRQWVRVPWGQFRNCTRQVIIRR